MFPRESVRRQLFVDRKIQGALVLRVTLYWAACLTAVTLLLCCWQIVTGPPRPFYRHFFEMWSYCGPAIVASLLLLPLVMVDLVRFSNRFVGPFLRVRGAMRALARGERVEPIEFRRGDFWKEFADELSAVAARVQDGLPPPTPQPDSEGELEQQVATLTV